MSTNSKTATLVKNEHVVFLSFFHIYFAFYIDDFHHVIRLLQFHLNLLSRFSKYIHHSYELAGMCETISQILIFFPPSNGY